MPDPVSWFVVDRGWEVVGSDGSKLGTVEEVLGDTELDVFDGLSVATWLLGKPRYVPSELVQPLRDRFRGRFDAGAIILPGARDLFEDVDEPRSSPLRGRRKVSETSRRRRSQEP